MNALNPHRFGRFVFDSASGHLTADGSPVPLGATASKLLSALVEGGGEVITKDELMSRVWGRSVVGDNTLQVQITALRKTLGDGFIVTKQGRGYRFIKGVNGSDPGAVRQPPGNLPTYLSQRSAQGAWRLIGRESQLRVLSRLIAKNALVTLVGPGGVGKTRLALHAASESPSQFPDGAWLVELASVADPALVVSTVATVLGIKIGEGVTPVETLARQLARRKLLIVLDNCEHVIAACARLTEAILQAAPGVKIVATSREPLSCFGEQQFAVPPLSVPRNDRGATSSALKTAAVELFVERMKGDNPHFRLTDEAISIAARICRRVDGLPLAIEMVAGWAGTLSLEALESKLEDSLGRSLTSRRTAPLRHSTLRSTIAWSYDLLSPIEQIVLRRLAAFAGAFSVAGIEAVVAHSGIDNSEALSQVRRLIDKSMVAVVPGTGERYYRLLETTRAFMLEKLAASDDLRQTRERHSNFVLDVVRRAIVDWEILSDRAFLDRYAPVLDDLRSALEWALEHDPQTAVALAGHSWPLWRELPVRAEGRRWLVLAKDRLRDATPAELEAHLRRGLGELYFNTADVKASREEFARAVVLFRAIGDIGQLGSAMGSLGYASLMLSASEGDFKAAQIHIEEALHLIERTKRPRALAAIWSVRFCAEARLRLPTMLEIGRKAIQLCTVVGAERTALVVSANLMEAILETGDVESSIESGQELLARLRDTYQTDILGHVLGILSAAYTLKGDPDEALPAARSAVPLLRDEGMLFWLFDHLALRAAQAGRTKDAALIAGYADFLFREFGRPREPIGAEAVSRLSGLLGESLAQNEIEQLYAIGAQLSQDKVIALALAD